MALPAQPKWNPHFASPIPSTSAALRGHAGGNDLRQADEARSALQSPQKVKISS
jgi:hypothetical protein